MGDICVLVLRWGGAEDQEEEVSHGSDITEQKSKNAKHHMEDDENTSDDTDPNTHGTDGTKD